MFAGDEKWRFLLQYSNHPVLYCLIYMIIDGLFAGTIALTSLSISNIVKSQFSAVVSPMVICIITSMLFPGNEYGNWAVLGMINPRQVVTTLWYQMVIVFLAILIVNSLIIWFISRKRDMFT